MVATTREGYLIPTYGPTGISPSAGAEAGMAAVRAVQTQREQTLTSRQNRDSVDQQMKIRTEEQRRIEENRAREAAERAQQQRAAAAAAARAAQRQAALDAYSASRVIPGATTPGAAATGAATPYVPRVMAPPVGPPTAAPVTRPGLAPPRVDVPFEPDSQFDIQNIELLSGELPMGDPRGPMQMPGVPGVTAPVGVRLPAPQRSFMTPESITERARIAQASSTPVLQRNVPLSASDALAAAGITFSSAPAPQAESRVAQAETFGAGVRNAFLDPFRNAVDSLGAVSGLGLAAEGAFLDLAGTGAAVVGAPGVSAELERRSDQRYNRALTNLRGGLSAGAGMSAADFDMEPAEFQAAIAEADALRAQLDAQRVEAGGPPLPPEVRQTGVTMPDAPTQPTIPVVNTSWGGPQPDFGTPVQVVQRETEGRGSETFVAAPEQIFDKYNSVQRERTGLVQLAELYRALGDAANLGATINQIEQLDEESQYLDGMLAIVGIQQGNFGPLQELMTARFPNQQVEVRPYTDETMEIVVDGQSEGRIAWGTMATELRSAYDDSYISMLNARATEAASRDTFEFENAVGLEAEFAKAQLEIIKKAAEIRTQEQFEQLYREGILELVDSERGLYNYVVDGVSVLVEALENADKSVSVVPIDTSAVPRL